MDEPPSPLLKSRIPRKTVIVERALWESFLLHVLKLAHHRPLCRIQSIMGLQIKDAHCPLRKGIICYCWRGAIFEYNIHSSGKHEVDSHVVHWESRIQLTIFSSHESLSRNLGRRIWESFHSSPSKAIASYYSQSTPLDSGRELSSTIYTYQSMKSALIIMLVLLCGLSTVALMVTSILMIWSW